MPKKPSRPPGYTEYTPGRRTYSTLDNVLRKQLEVVRGSSDGDFVFKPCEVTLSDGTIVDRVYIADANSYIKHWGVWPEDDRGKSFIDISKVTSIRASLNRLPIRFANLLYKAGESAMGGSIFTVFFKDGTRQVYVTGNSVDFIPYPDGKTAGDIVRVSPHEGREDPNKLPGCNYHWCLHGTGESSRILASH